MTTETIAPPERRVELRPQRGADTRMLLCFAVALAPLIVLAVLGWERRWITDDGFIHLRVVQELLGGHGPVFNAGERIESSTSPLWVLLLAATREVFFFVKLEWITVLWGLVGSIAGLAMAERGAWLLALRSRGPSDRPRLFLPLGACVVAALPPFWDFATSGLETGMVFAWLGGSFWALTARLSDDPNEPTRGHVGRPLWGTTVLFGLGVLIRPDLALVSGAFLLALIVVDPDRRWKHRALVVLAAGAIPLAYQVFRMMYYAALEPNTAIVKEPGLTNWTRGWHYLWDFGQPYWLWLPIAIVAVILGARIASVTRDRRWGPLIVTIAPIVSGTAYAVYVVRMGGDFMHARLMLPALYAVLLPVAVVPIRNVRTIIGVAVVGLWAIGCAFGLRVGYEFGGPFLLSNERNVYVRQAGHRNPVTIGDYARGWAQWGTEAKERADRGERVLHVVHSNAYPYDLTLPLAPNVKAKGVVAYPAIGQIAYAAGPDIYVADLLGLGDPIGSRIKVKQFFLPGHNKQSDPSWTIARFTEPGVKITDTWLADRTANARVAITCGQLARLLHDVSGPATPSKLVDGLRDSWANTKLRFDEDPAIARKELCR